MMKRFLLAWLATALPFLALDAGWLSTMSGRLYRPAIGPLLRPDFDLLPAVAFYLLYVTGVVVFAVWPALRTRDALWRGALLGLVAYATYDLSNQATLAGWPWHLALIDMAWGTVATATAAAIAHRVTSRPSRR